MLTAAITKDLTIQSTKSMSIKILEYNIEHGFHTGAWGEEKKKPFIFQPERMIAAQDVVKAENPDVLVLIEACFADSFKETSTGRTIAMPYKRIFDFPYESHVTHKYEWGTVVLSRIPILDTRIVIVDERHSLEVRLDTTEGPLCVHAAHVKHDWLESQKETYLSALGSMKQGKYVIVGDFNALSDQDPYEKNRMLRGFEKLLKPEDARAKVDDILQRTAVAALSKDGMVDTFLAAGRPWMRTLPTLAYDPRNTRDDSGSRLDYIFCSPDLKVLDAYVIQNELTDKASDHYPIVAILE